MKRFLVLGLVFVVVLMFLGKNGYAEEGEISRQFFLSYGIGNLHPAFEGEEDDPYAEHLSLLYLSKNGKFFSESTLYFYKPAEFAITGNWMILGYYDIPKYKFYEKFMIGIYAGVGVLNGAIKEQGKKETLVSAHVGFKWLFSIFYIDARLNVVPYGVNSWAQNGNAKFYSTFAMGLSF